MLLFEFVETRGRIYEWTKIQWWQWGAWPCGHSATERGIIQWPSLGFTGMLSFVLIHWINVLKEHLGRWLAEHLQVWVYFMRQNYLNAVFVCQWPLTFELLSRSPFKFPLGRERRHIILVSQMLWLHWCFVQAISPSLVSESVLVEGLADGKCCIRGKCCRAEGGICTREKLPSDCPQKAHLPLAMFFFFTLFNFILCLL